MSDYDGFWLSPEDLVAINETVGGPGSGVTNYEGVCSNAERPMTDVFGHKEFPTIWDKAACLLHSIATTQYFSDGNKRTAWEACTHFLMAHGETLRPMPWMNKGAAILSAAVDLLSIQEIAQWLYVNRLRPKDRVDFAAIAMPLPVQESKKFAHILPAQIQAVRPDQPFTHASVVTRVFWHQIDIGSTKTLSVRLKPIGDCEISVRPESHTQMSAEVEAGIKDPVFPNGVIAWHHEFILMVSIFKPGRSVVEFLIDGEVAATDYLTLEHTFDVPDVVKFKI